VDVVPIQGGVLGDGVVDKIRREGWGHRIGHGGVFVFFFSGGAHFLGERDGPRQEK
jgi:hypothetical protein